MKGQRESLLLSEDLQKNYRRIIEAEASFARAVALGLWAKRPLTAWHYLLPGMFIFDLLRRNQAVKQYSEVFLFPRKTALDAALAVAQGEDREKRMARTGEEIRRWLESLKIGFDTVQRAHATQIDLLIDHYSRLLLAPGNDRPALLRSAYLTREGYESFLRRLTAAEQEVDRALAEAPGATLETLERLRAEQAMVAELRGKELDRVFPTE